MGAVLGSASLLAEQPAGNSPPSAPSVDAPGIASATPERPGEPELPRRVADAGGAPQPSDTPQVGIETTTAPLPQTDTAPPATPDAAQSTAGLAPPVRETDGTITATAETPVLPNPQAAPPAVPADEADVVLETTTPPLPEPEPQPVIVVEDAPEEEDAPVEDDGATDDIVVAVIVEPEALDAAVAPEASDTLETEEVPDAPGAVEGDVEPTDDVEEVDPAAEPVDAVETDGTEPEVAENDAPEATGETDAGDAPEEDTPEEIVVVVEPDDDAGAGDLPSTDLVAAAPEVPDAPNVPGAPGAPEGPAETEALAEPAAPEASDAPAPRIALSGDGGGVTLPGANSGVRVIRPDSTAPEAAEPEAEEVVTVDPSAPALERFAAPLDNPEGRPLMSVVLIDDGALDGAVPAVAGVPFDVSVAIDPTSAGAAERMASYRAAGIEVVAIAVVPEGATPSDAEVALEAAFTELPEAVALLDTGDGGLRSDRDLTEQAMARLSADGRGFIMQSEGLNTGLRMAEAAAVPGGLIYRDLDSNDQTAQVIRRFLDQAAFRAGQQSGVILLGRVRADTLSALTLWGSANRAGQVALAPISATLTGQ